MIQLSIRLSPPPWKRDEVVRAVRSRLRLVRAERGCLGCHLYLDLDDQQTLGLMEWWGSPEDLQRHASTDFFRELLVWLELSTRMPEVSFHGIPVHCGFNYLFTLCGETGQNGVERSRSVWAPLNARPCQARTASNGSCPLNSEHNRLVDDTKDVILPCAPRGIG